MHKRPAGARAFSLAAFSKKALGTRLANYQNSIK
jgi:hypothetical protein